MTKHIFMASMDTEHINGMKQIRSARGVSFIATPLLAHAGPGPKATTFGAVYASRHDLCIDQTCMGAWPKRAGRANRRDPSVDALGVFAACYILCHMKNL
jgi:hypothetical protein